MTESTRWLQIKGDPSVRSFLFDQQRVESIFDHDIDRLIVIVRELLVMRGVFHAKLHFSSNQLTCWLFNDPYRYKVYIGEEVFEPGFTDQFHKAVAIERPVIGPAGVERILAVFKTLRLKDETVYLRNASINRINGLIGMSFSCDGSHYIPYESFFETVELF